MIDVFKAMIISACLVIFGLLAMAVAAMLLPFSIFAALAFIVWVVIQIDKAGKQDPDDRRNPHDKG